MSCAANCASSLVRLCAGFRMPAMIDGATYTLAGVRKPPRNNLHDPDPSSPSAQRPGQGRSRREPRSAGPQRHRRGVHRQRARGEAAWSCCGSSCQTPQRRRCSCTRTHMKPRRSEARCRRRRRPSGGNFDHPRCPRCSRHRDGLRNAGRAQSRCAARGDGHVLPQQSGSSGRAGGSLRDPRNLCAARIRHRRWPDELWLEHQ